MHVAARIAITAAAFNFDDPDHPAAAPFTAPGLDETLSSFGEEVMIAVNNWDSGECYTSVECVTVAEVLRPCRRLPHLPRA